MNDTFRLGRIAGIPIGLNWTWLIIFGLIVWSLASSVFPAANPGLGTTTYVEMGVAATLLFFASLLLHELGHAFEARREGVAIEGITLWIFGGVARFRGMFPSPGAEFRIAIAGPLVTAVLAAAFIAVAVLTRFHPAVDGVFAWLGYINLLLLGFNLLPALPLDGGRVFRSALWRIKGDFGRATQIAVLLGRVIGGSMIAIGVLSFFTVGAFSGVWLALIGWFVFGAAGAEARLLAVQNAVDGRLVADVMRADPLTAQADETLLDFMAHVNREDEEAAYPVLDGVRPVGVLPTQEVERTPSDEWATVRVRERMAPVSRARTLEPDEPAIDAILAFAGAGEESVLVLEHGRLVGVVYARDVADALGVGARRPWAGPRRGTQPGSPVIRLGARPVALPPREARPPRDAA